MLDSSSFDDHSHRYAPTRVVVNYRDNTESHNPAFAWAEVQGYIVYPPNQHGASPIDNEITAVKAITPLGVRWYGCERAYINAELKLVVVGHNSDDEVRRRWPVVDPKLQA